jgi:uncharacterized protein
MLEFKQLTIEDKSLFDKYIKPYTFNTSEYSFTSLFIWRIGCDIHYTIYKNVLIIKKQGFDGSIHFMQPIGYTEDNLKEVVDILIEYSKNNNMKYVFKDIETDFINNLKVIYKDTFLIEEDRDNFDYIYNSSDLINLSGKKYHSKKNHYNNFIKNNVYRTEALSKEVIQDCIKASEDWCKKNKCEGYLLYELNGIKELFHNSEKLDFQGIAVYVDETLSAFSIGEKMNDNLAIIHIEKADSDINGLYTFINKAFVENYFSDVPFINREQDLGIPGLRDAKLTYKPVKLEVKYSVSILHR